MCFTSKWAKRLPCKKEVIPLEAAPWLDIKLLLVTDLLVLPFGGKLYGQIKFSYFPTMTRNGGESVMPLIARIPNLLSSTVYVV